MEESPDHLPAVGPDMDDDMVALADLVPLVHQLRAGGYRVIGPTVRDGAIVLAELESADDLPYGWGVETSPGRYRLRRRVDRAAFGHAAGPRRGSGSCTRRVSRCSRPAGTAGGSPSIPRRSRPSGTPTSACAPVTCARSPCRTGCSARATDTSRAARTRC
jgi:hypothetical protein